ncbi:MAG: type II toxin-antitoxin system RelE/ParE family toxin [Alphaproteobacteria bacterium]|nr:type II toxin-antitoxin system RelE/ParE family toxin [Alphaproteobacteria bacterium]
MAARTILILGAARRDLIAIERYIRNQAGRRIATQAIDRILDKLDTLKAFPESAPLHRDLDGAPRVATVARWRIVFEYDAHLSRILVWRVIDGRRDLPSLVQRPSRKKP